MTSSVVPFRVLFTTASAGTGTGVVAIDDVSFEGCFADTTAEQVEEVR